MNIFLIIEEDVGPSKGHLDCTLIAKTLAAILWGKTKGYWVVSHRVGAQECLAQEWGNWGLDHIWNGCNESKGIHLLDQKRGSEMPVASLGSPTALWDDPKSVLITQVLFRNTVKPLLSGPPIKRTPSMKRTLSRVPKLTSYISLYNEPLFGGHLY